jgi:hypothetical protein
MYTLRTFDSEGIEENLYLGKNYQFIDRHSNKEAFQRAYENAFGKSHVADLDETETSSSKNCGGFLYDENGVLIYLSKDKTHYIVSSNGKTFDNLSLRIGRNEKICA